MSFNKKFFTTGGIVASAPPAAAVFDPLQNFETVTYTGNGSTQKITGYIRKGAAFNGSSSNINIVGGVGMGVNNFSYSFWFNTTNITSANANIITPNADHASYGLQLNTSSLGMYPTTGNYLQTSTGIISPNTWYHVVYTKSSTTGHTIYLNGSSVATDATFTGDYNVGNQGKITFGSANNNIQWFSGKLDQVRFFNKALDQDDVDDLYLETYADPKKSTTDYFGDGSGVALYELDDDANSSNFEQAAVFNGSSSYISTGINFSTLPNTKSISMWIKSTGSSSVGLGGTSGTSTNDGLFVFDELAGNVAYIPKFGGYHTGDASTVILNQWNHFVVTDTNVNGNVKMYINGSEVTVTKVNSAVYTSNTNMEIGRQKKGDGTIFWQTGSIDQVRIFNTALGQADVTKLYQESSTIPTANLIAHYKLDGNAEDVLDTYDGTASNVTYSAGVYGGTPTNVNFLGMAFQPDLVWLKNRDGAYDHRLFDSVRGADKTIQTNNTRAEYDGGGTGYMSSFDSNGFTLSSGNLNTNNNGTDYVAWCWKAGGSVTPNNNTDGDITSTVSANQDAGFSIATWSGDDTASNIGHGLGGIPELMIIKNRTGTNSWIVGVPDVLGTGYLILNDYGVASTSNVFGQVPDSTRYYFNTAAGGNGHLSTGNYVGYFFRSITEYQKVGSYLGSSSTVTVTTGFEPRFVMIKRTNAIADWILYDQVRSGGTDMDDYLTPNSTLVEQQNSAIDITAISTGFTVESGNWQGVNTSGGEYIYLAIA